MGGPEKRYEQKIKKFLDDEGAYWIKIFANRNTKSGLPDICACINGVFVAIEVKASDGKPTPLQVWNRDRIRDAGGIAIILYPEDFNAFMGLVHEIEAGNSAVKLQSRFDRE